MYHQLPLACLVVFTLSFSVPSQCTPLYILSAPNLLRLGNKEHVFVEAQEYFGNPIEVTISVKEYPNKRREFASVKVTLSANNQFQALQEIMIGENFFEKVSTKNQYVYLEAKFPDRVLEKDVLISFSSGYIFVQTDKTLYTPTNTVFYRVFSFNPSMEPRENEISVEIVTPDGITIKKDVVLPRFGIHSGNFELPDIISIGTWKIVGKFNKAPQKNFTGEFEVKEYVLPTFEVKLTSKPFFYIDDESLTIDISAKYLYGKDVTGNAIVLFGVMSEDGQSRTFPASLQRVEIGNGEGKAVLTRAHIRQDTNDINKLLGFSLFVKVNVLTSTGTEMVEAEKKGIFIVTSPYTIHFKKTSKYFKPGMPFDIAVYVTNPDNSPAGGINLKLTPGSSSGTTKANGMAKLSVNTVSQDNKGLTVKVETNEASLSADRQARREMTAIPYQTYHGSNNYLHISVQETEITIGDQIIFFFSLYNSLGVQDQLNHITYMVVSKGQIVLAKRQARTKGQALISLTLPITKEMVPSFRFVAYYHLGSAEVVSDSIWVDVKDTCLGKLKVSSEKREYEPGEAFSLNLEGDPGARVGLVAVDKGVYVLNSQYRISQGKIWDTVEKHDIGCTAGGGADNMGVFYDAGLIFQSSAPGVETKQRSDLDCPAAPKRRRRSVTMIDFKATMVDRYKTELQKQCCRDGMVENLMRYTCKRRSQYIDDGAECVQAFIECCEEITKKRAAIKGETYEYARSNEEGEYLADHEIVSRSFFPESWLWQEVILPSCQPGNQACPSTSVSIESFMMESITTWEITAVSLSKTHGICVADPYEMKVTKQLFVNLKLPYSALRNEQLEIKAVIYNYFPADKKVRVTMMETPTVCSAASKKGNYRQEIKIPAMSSVALPFVIIPMSTGKHSIEVKASIENTHYGDGEKKDLLVVPEGVKTKKEKTVVLDPSSHGGTQKAFIEAAMLRYRVPNSPAQTYISVTGELLAQTIESVISGNTLGHLIELPSGCGEQNMISMTGSVITTHYMDNTGQWEKLGIDKRTTAIQYINIGYTGQLSYRKPDGSYAVFLRYKSSTWLTAYVIKVFSMASNLISIDEDVICSASKWLILNAQQPDGVFREDGRVYQSEMMGGVKGSDSDASLTAFVLIALQEARSICAPTLKSLQDSIRTAAEFLQRRMTTLTNPYAVTLTSYALANEGKHQLDTLLKFSSPDKSHWPVAGGHIFTLEATAYALLALVKAKEYDKASKLVVWLTEQRFYGGGYGSTQATIIVFQALSQYMMEAESQKQIDLQVDVAVNARSLAIPWSINNKNAYVARSLKAHVDENITVTATGKGQGVVSVMTLYHAMPDRDKKPCANFDLSVNFVKERGRHENILETWRLEIDMFYTSRERDATMSILDITLLTGFEPDETDLKALSTGKDRYIQRFEMNNLLSQKGSLILYIDKISHSLPDRVVFRLHKMQNVGLLQPGSVKLYEYNSLEKHCMKFYHPQKEDGKLNRICHADVCQCAEENCSLQKKLKVTDVDRYRTACADEINYVYKGKVTTSTLTPTTDSYTIRIEEVFKEDTDTTVLNQEREFIAHPYCREALDLVEGKSYLLMGKSEDLIKGDKDVYILGGGTWIEYWPTSEECKDAKYKNYCAAITTATNDLLTFGCPQK